MELKYCFQKEDGTALEQADMVSCSNVMSHSLVDSVTINLGNCDLIRDNSNYALLARLNYITNYTKNARQT